LQSPPKSGETLQITVESKVKRHPAKQISGISLRSKSKKAKAKDRSREIVDKRFVLINKQNK
jgi:hypothetical protein